MDILIKNMEMPKSCEGCFACEEFSYECYDYCNILKAPTTRGERRKDCPLVALPEHGDLIDRGLVQEVLAQLLPLVITNELTDKEIGLVHRTVGAIAEMINEQEVVVEANNE